MAAAKVLLVLVTLVCLASMGGAMLAAAPVVVPLHVLAARRSGPYGAGGWTFLAGASLFEFGWMWTYIATEDAATSLAAGVLLSAAAMAVILRDTASRAAVGRGLA